MQLFSYDRATLVHLNTWITPAWWRCQYSYAPYLPPSFQPSLPPQPVGIISRLFSLLFLLMANPLQVKNYLLCGSFYFPWHRHQLKGTNGFNVSSERHQQCEVKCLPIPRKTTTFLRELQRFYGNYNVSAELQRCTVAFVVSSLIIGRRTAMLTTSMKYVLKCLIYYRALTKHRHTVEMFIVK